MHSDLGCETNDSACLPFDHLETAAAFISLHFYHPFVQVLFFVVLVNIGCCFSFLPLLGSRVG
jgi:hypothetical protein